MEERGYIKVDEVAATRMQALCKAYAVRRAERIARVQKEMKANELKYGDVWNMEGNFFSKIDKEDPFEDMAKLNFIYIHRAFFSLHARWM